VLPLLRTLCTLGWQPALSALLGRLAGQQLDALHLLSELYAAPPEAEAAAAQLAALHCAATVLEHRRPRGGKGKAAQDSGESSPEHHG